jgi:hypothetical protein
MVQVLFGASTCSYKKLPSFLLVESGLHLSDNILRIFRGIFCANSLVSLSWVVHVESSQWSMFVWRHFPSWLIQVKSIFYARCRHLLILSIQSTPLFDNDYIKALVDRGANLHSSIESTFLLWLIGEENYTSVWVTGSEVCLDWVASI